MRRVHIQPLPAHMRGKFFWSYPPQVFPDGPPTAEEIDLAEALYWALDEESRSWYDLRQAPGRFVERIRERYPQPEA